MSAIITIDNGNTATKLKVHSTSGELLYSQVYTFPYRIPVSDIISQYDVKCAAICSVGAVNIELQKYLMQELEGRLLVLGKDTEVPIKVCYATPHTLGADRVAAACGAVAAFPGTPLLIADAGTALTLDLIDADSSFLGGNISPGIKLRLQSLHEHTAALPQVQAQGPLPEFGIDTPTALRCGAIRGVAYEITGAFATAASLYKDIKLILTGGDSPLISPLLPTETICRADLVSDGLISILKHNEYI